MKHIGENENKISKNINLFRKFPMEWIILLLLCWVVNIYIGGKLFLLGVVESHGPGASILDLSINRTLAIQQPKKMTTPHPECFKDNMWVITKLTSIIFTSKSFSFMKLKFLFLFCSLLSFPFPVQKPCGAFCP